MSAYLVSDNHMDVLVNYFIDNRTMHQLWTRLNGEYQYLTEDNAHILAHILYTENVRSVNNRYDEENSDEAYEFKRLKYVKQTYSVAEMAGALDCLEYQSCDREDYLDSEAWYNLCNMRKHLLKKIQEQELGENTVWEINDIKQIIAGMPV